MPADGATSHPAERVPDAPEAPRDDGTVAPPSSSAPDLAKIRLTEESEHEEEKQGAAQREAPEAEKQDADDDDEVEVIEPQAKDDLDQAEQPHKLKGIPVEDLATIREMYDKRELFGYPEDEFVKYPHNAELNDKLILWSVVKIAASPSSTLTVLTYNTTGRET